MHDELVLASAVATYNEQAIYVTGGNDDCVAIWALGSIVKQPIDSAKTNNGLMHAPTIPNVQLISR